MIAELASGDGGIGWALLMTVFLAGLRHGVDLDHLAAISDIASSQLNRRRALVLSTIYAAGHGLVLTLLGLGAVLAGARVPSWLDSFMGRVVGVTLVILGLYVIYTLVRYGRQARVRSRWMLVLAGVRRTLSWLKRTSSEVVSIEHSHAHHHVPGHRHEHQDGHGADLHGVQSVAVATRHTHLHRHVATMPRDPFTEYGGATAFGIGMIHGVGAETPTQVLLFATAAGTAGSWAGALLLVAFTGGLFLANTAVAVATTFGFAQGQRLPVLFVGLAATTAIVSLVVGASYVIGRGDLLPAFLGG